MRYLLPESEIAPESVNKRNTDNLAGTLGIIVSALSRAGAAGYLEIEPRHLAPNGFLHAGTVVSLADSLCGIACVASLPDTAAGFTTIELKSNFFATATHGRIIGEAVPLHLGGTTQVWDCEVTYQDNGRRLALFRCTQLVLKPK